MPLSVRQFVSLLFATPGQAAVAGILCTAFVVGLSACGGAKEQRDAAGGERAESFARTQAAYMAWRRAAGAYEEAMTGCFAQHLPPDRFRACVRRSATDAHDADKALEERAAETEAATCRSSAQISAHVSSATALLDSGARHFASAVASDRKDADGLRKRVRAATARLKAAKGRVREADRLMRPAARECG
jgi:hypothetical protein